MPRRWEPPREEKSEVKFYNELTPAEKEEWDKDDEESLSYMRSQKIDKLLSDASLGNPYAMEIVRKNRGRLETQLYWYETSLRRQLVYLAIPEYVEGFLDWQKFFDELDRKMGDATNPKDIEKLKFIIMVKDRLVRIQDIMKKEATMRDRIIKLATLIKEAESEHMKWRKKMKIRPEKRTEHSNFFSIGFSEVDKKWYGWSHRARFGWKVGDKVEKDTSGNPRPGEEWTIKTESEAKQMAKDFAESVS